VLEVVVGTSVAVESVEWLDGVLCGAIGEVVDGEDGLGAGFEVELDEEVRSAERDERGFEHAGEHLDGGELPATSQDLWVQGHEAPPATVATPLAAFLASSGPLTPSGNAASYCGQLLPAGLTSQAVPKLTSEKFCAKSALSSQSATKTVAIL
jgi:hypothetical protein